MGVPEATTFPSREDTSQVRLLHDLAKIHATFDDPNLVSRAGPGTGDGAGLPGGPAGAGGGAQASQITSGQLTHHQRTSSTVLPGGCGWVPLSNASRPSRSEKTWAPSTLGRSCGGTCCSWARCSGCCWPSWRVWRRCCLAGRRWRSSQSTPSKTGLRPQEQGAAFGYTKIQGKSLLVRGLNVPLAASDAAGSW